MELSIIITSYRNPSLLKVCIDSIKKTVQRLEYEVIVCDSATEEDTELMMREDYPDIAFFPHEKNVGFFYLVNEGIEKSKGTHLLFLNEDIVVKEGAINALYEFVRSNSQVGLAGPKLLNFNGTLQPSCFRFYTPLTPVFRRTFLGKTPWGKAHLRKVLMEDYDHVRTKEVDWIMGSALMVSKEAVEKVGHMDSRFKMYFEDTDWCRRFWEQGYKVVYFPQSAMHHYHGRGSKNSSVLQSLLFNRLAWLHITSAFKFFFKYWGRERPVHD